MRDGLSKKFGRPEGGVRHADALHLSEEIQRMQVILEGLYTGAIRIPGSGVRFAGACCTEEPL